MIIEDSEIEYEFISDRKPGMHTNGPEYGRIKITHTPTGFTVISSVSKYTHKTRQLLRTLLELGLTDCQ
jgi:hypothetical protein